MKTKFYYLLIMISIALSLPSCLNDEPWDDFSTVKPVIELPYSSHTSTITSKDGKSVTFQLMVNYTIADWRNQNDKIVVGLGIDESLIGKNNLLPASAYSLPETMTIPELTQLTTTDLTVNVTGLTTGKYTLPVVIKSVPEGYTMSGNFNYVLFTVNVQ